MNRLPLPHLRCLATAAILLSGASGCAVDGANAPPENLRPPVGPLPGSTAGSCFSTTVLRARATARSNSAVSPWRSDGGCAPEVPFAHQPVTGTCPGFLVAEDLPLTAGHCTERGECWPYPFVFGLDEARARTGRVAATDIYYCREVIDFLVHGDEDWALLRLDRPAAGRTPLPLSRGSRTEPTERVVAIGHPTALPLKVALHGQVAETDIGCDPVAQNCGNGTACSPLSCVSLEAETGVAGSDGIAG